jgi:hypothetical protein
MVEIRFYFSQHHMNQEDFLLNSKTGFEQFGE